MSGCTQFMNNSLTKKTSNATTYIAPMCRYLCRYLCKFLHIHTYTYTCDAATPHDPLSGTKTKGHTSTLEVASLASSQWFDPVIFAGNRRVKISCFLKKYLLVWVTFLRISQPKYPHSGLWMSWKSEVHEDGILLHMHVYIYIYIHMIHMNSIC